VGWHDIVFEVPSDWNLAALSGTARSGYLRVDSPGTLGVQVKWDCPRPPSPKLLFDRLKSVLLRTPLPPFSPDVGVVLDQYESALRRTCRKSRQPLRFQRRRPGRLGESQEGILFSWKADRKAAGWVWFCQVCRRVVIAEVIGETSDPVLALAASIRPTLRDHPDSEGHLWGLYDLTVRVPDGFHLEAYRLMNVMVDLTFAAREQTLWVVSWGLANLALKDRSLAEWFKANCTQRFRDYGYTLREETYRGHAALRLQGFRTGFWPKLRAMSDLLRFRPAMSRLEAIVWHCERENKIYLIARSFARSLADLQRVADSVICHRRQRK